MANDMTRAFRPAADRNKGPILAVLKTLFAEAEYVFGNR